ncbi:MAG: winged helix-turn-helix transcriptional regulator [Candidatus Thorarchaeota archaeon]
MPKRKRKLTDEMLLRAVTELGGTGKAPELGELLGFPERTIRYRLRRLKEKGHLHRKWPQTFDAKLGLGEVGLFFEMTEQYRNLSREFLFCFKNLYINYATYGLYNGIFTAGGFPIENPKIIDRLIQALKRMNIIKNCYRFDTIDFIPLPADLSKYNPTTGWSWDWRDWVNQSEKAFKAGEPSGFEFDWDYKTLDHDHKDIAIIAEIKTHGHISPKEISKLVGLSDTQVRFRIRRLMEERVLRGSLWLIPPTPNSMTIYTFVELDPPNEAALNCFRFLPFRREIFIDKPNKFCVRITMNSSDLVGYLKAFESLRNHFDSYFFQTIVNPILIPGGMHGFYHLHNESTGRWEMPVEEYILDLEKFLEKY